MSTRPDHTVARRSYDRLSRWYDLISLGQEDRPRRRALAALGLRAGERVLEIGCGTGSALAPMAAAVGPAGLTVGIDLASGMLRVARRKLQAKAEATVCLACGDWLRLPVARGEFDAIFLSFTLELLSAEEMTLALAECRLALRPVGRLGLVSLSERAGWTAVNRLYARAHTRWPHFLDCRPIAPREVLEAAGFAITAVEKMSLWGLGVEALVACKE